MSTLGVFIGGEGPNEIGGSSGATSAYPGVVEALLRSIRRDGWSVIGSRRWAGIVKLRARGATPGDEQNVLGLVLEASRKGAGAVAFVRDADNQAERVATIRRGIQRAQEEFPDIRVVGGCPFPVLEAWILAVLGKTGTENLRKARAIEQAQAEGIRHKNTQDMVDAIGKMDPKRLPSDATGLRRWLNDAEAALARGS